MNHLNQELIEIDYSPHRIKVTASGNTCPLTMRWQFMPLYGPQEWFDFEPQTRTPAAEHSVSKEK